MFAEANIQVGKHTGKEKQQKLKSALNVHSTFTMSRQYVSTCLKSYFAHWHILPHTLTKYTSSVC